MDINAAISAGSANPLLLFAMALVLGALHGLEPGHSKTMMAAYIVAIRGSVAQAMLLGLSAAASHVVVVWVLVLVALRYGQAYIGEDLEPVLMSVSGVIVFLIGLWVFRQSLRARKRVALAQHHHDHRDHHHHGHSHGHGHAQSHAHSHDHDHAQSHDHPHHGDTHEHLDAHARAHARQIEARLENGRSSTWQTIVFGLTGGLIPCPGAITVLLLCLQLKKVTLGVTLVGAFSIGLAATLVTVGVVAAVGLRYATSRAPWLDGVLAKAPFVSAALICLLGLAMLLAGLSHAHP